MPENKKIFVCGDSWMSSSPETPGMHFSEIVSKSLGWDLYNIARAGMSNGGICAQIEFAIKFRPDLIIYNSTSPDRMEFPTRDNSGIPLDASHFAYPYKNSTSSGLGFLNKDTRMISDTLLGMGSWFTPDFISELYGEFCPDVIEKQKAIKSYIEHLYCHQWKSQTDRMLLYSMTHKILASRINFIFVCDSLGAIGEMKWLENVNIGYSYDLLINRRDYHIEKEFGHENFRDPGYHTTTETQKEIAEHTLEKIRILGI